LLFRMGGHFARLHAAAVLVASSNRATARVSPHPLDPAIPNDARRYGVEMMDYLMCNAKRFNARAQGRMVSLSDDDSDLDDSMEMTHISVRTILTRGVIPPDVQLRQSTRNLLSHALEFLRVFNGA
jgi:hypothetical protein